MEEVQYLCYLPKGVSPPGYSVEVRGRDNVDSDWLGDELVNLLNSFRLRLFEECPSGEMRYLGPSKKLWIGSTTVARMFLGSLGLCELSFAMLMMVRDNRHLGLYTVPYTVYGRTTTAQVR